MSVRLRFAPSPTGYLHIGSARSALYTWMYARHYDGQFILRIEDTDVKRTRPGAREEIMASLRWLGLDWDEGPDIGGPYGPYVQTERAALYQHWGHWLVARGRAYKCFCTPEELAARREAAGQRSPQGYDRRCRYLSPAESAAREAAGQPYVIRFKMPLEGATLVPDLLRGDIRFQNERIPDYVLLKSSSLPTYHLAHPVDDHFMRISHVTRGIEWLSTAPLHVNLFRAFGWELPLYVHMPVILNPSGRGKLSKRKQAFDDQGQQILVRVEEFRAAGYLPEALNNFLASVGWSFGGDREIFSLAEAIERFELADINPAETRLPYEKLDWLNGQYIQAMAPAELARGLQAFLEGAGLEAPLEALLHLAPSLSVRLKRWSDAPALLQFLAPAEPAALSPEALTDKNLDREAALAAFSEARAFVATAEPYDLETIGEGLRQIGERHSASSKAGPFLGRLRLAVTGQSVSPPLFESMLALGRGRSLAQLDAALAVLS
ncbi:MAG: glutamate--tRNA ligase [Candidatus Promineifilaceae bacterium]